MVGFDIPLIPIAQWYICIYLQYNIHTYIIYIYIYTHMSHMYIYTCHICIYIYIHMYIYIYIICLSHHIPSTSHHIPSYHHEYIPYITKAGISSHHEPIYPPCLPRIFQRRPQARLRSLLGTAPSPTASAAEPWCIAARKQNRVLAMRLDQRSRGKWSKIVEYFWMEYDWLTWNHTGLYWNKTSYILKISMELTSANIILK